VNDRVSLSTDDREIAFALVVSVSKKKKICHQFDLVNLINKSLRDIGQIGHGTPFFN